RALLQISQRRRRHVGGAPSRGGLDELNKGEAADAELIVLARRASAGQSLLVAPESVVQDRGHVAGLTDRASLAPHCRVRHRRLEVLPRACLEPPPCTQSAGGIGQGRVA